MAFSKTSNTPREKSIKYLNKDFNDFKAQLTEFAQSHGYDDKTIKDIFGK